VPVSFLGGSGRARGPTATRKCMKCGYALLAEQSRCPECGESQARAAPRAKHLVVELHKQGPHAVWPVASRFVAMGVVAAAGPLAIILSFALALVLGLGGVPNFGAAIAWLMAPLPIVVLLSMPFGWGSIGGDESPVPVERARIFGVAIHKIALLLCPAWWCLAGLLLFGAASPAAIVLFIVSMFAAATSAYLHLCWLADLGLAISDEGPHRVLNICVGIAIICGIVALIAALFASTWGPTFLAVAFTVLAVVIGEISASVQLARDMLHTLVASYEEHARQQRRAARDAENERRFH